MSNLSNSKTNVIYLLFFTLSFILISEIAAQEQNQILYPSVLSLNNQGLVAVEADGIHFYDSDKNEEITKKIKFESALISQEDTYKISMTQFSENDGGFILILVIDKLFLIRETGEIIKEILLPEMKKLENMNIITYKEINNNLYYIISFKKNAKHYSFNYYKYDLIKNSNSLINSKSLEGIKNKGNFISNDIHGESCLFMKELETEKDIFSCFLGVGFPAEIQVRTFDINDELIKEKNSYRYSLGQYDIKSFNLISALLTNDNKSSSIIYYDKNNILSKIEFDFEQGLFSPNIIDIEKEVNLTDEFWEEASKKMDESKESIYSSRLYLAYCKSYIIFFNSNFTLQNKGFISHDNKCSKLLSYSEFFKDNKYSLSIERINNNKILIQKKRKLARSCAETPVPVKCKNSNDGYSDESLTYNLCKLCNKDAGYYKVYDPNNTIYSHGKGFVECFNEDTKKNFYLDNSTGNDENWQYKPCYETCNTCSEGGTAYDHKCDTCALKYKFFEDSVEHKKLCEAECSYAYYYTFPLDYYECSSTNSCPEEANFYVPELKKCVKSCENEPEYKYNYAGNCYRNCDEAKAEREVGTNNCKDKPREAGDPRCIVTYNSFDSENFITAEGITSNAKTYAKSFSDTTTHVNYYNNSNAILVIYKDETCITELGLTVPKIDLDDTCDEKIYEYLRNKYSDFNKETDLITALVGGSTSSSGVKSLISLFHKDGTYINTTEICGVTQVSVKNQIDLEEVNDEAELIASQGVDIFDLDSPFYNDVCFMYDSPNGKDATPNDRLNKYYPNISICETGCTPSKVNLTSFEAICKCEFNDIMSSSGVGEKLIEDSFGEIFEMIDNSNIVIFKCISDVFVAKHFFKNVGTYIALGIMVGQIACVVAYYLVGYSPIMRYLYYLMEYQCTVIDLKIGKKEKDKIKDNILNPKLQKPKAPPKKDGLKTPAADKLILDDDKKDPKKLDLNENDPNINSNNKLNKKKDEKETGKKGGKNEKKSGSGYGDKLKDEFDVDMEEYLKTDVEDMEFEDALKYDKRGFCEYFLEKFKEEQIIMDTFFNSEALKPMTIKIIILLLNIILYFVINGLFYSEAYVSDLFNSEEEEKFFSFFPRSISRFLYTTIVGVIIGIIVDFVSVDEKKVKRLFLREKKNTLQIRYEMGEITKDIKRNYLILIIICFVIDLICLYYVNCFNNVYPNLTGEWIKSSICIIIIMQILTVLEGLLIAIIRLIAFKCKSERIYKIKDLFD